MNASETSSADSAWINRLREVLLHPPKALSREESARIAQIEALRDRMLRSSQVLSIPDFGAGPRWKKLLGFPPPNGKLQQKTLSQVCRQASKPQKWALLLFHLVRALKPECILELGSCLGVSAAYMAAAQALNGGATLYTIEGAAALADMARQNLEELSFEQAEVLTGRFTDVLPGLLERLSKKIDLAFIDGHHEGEATLQYWGMIKPHLSSRALVIFDDIHWSAGMRNAWEKLKKDRLAADAVNLGQFGVLLIARHL